MKVRHLLILLCALLLPIGDAASRETPIITDFGGFPMAVNGLEQWDINSAPYKITNSYYLVSDNKVEFAVEFPLSVDKSIKTLTYKQGLNVALPVIKHAFQKGVYKRKSFKGIGTLPAVEVHSITAILYQHDGVTTRIFRINLTIDNLETYNQAKTIQTDEELQTLLVGSWTSDPVHKEDDDIPHLSKYNSDGTLIYTSYLDKACTKTDIQDFATWEIKDGYLNITLSKSSDKGFKTSKVITDQIVKIDKTSMELIAVDSVSKEPSLNSFNSPRQFRKRSASCL